MSRIPEKTETNKALAMIVGRNLCNSLAVTDFYVLSRAIVSDPHFLKALTFHLHQPVKS